MSTADTATLANIQRAASKEFLDKGFQDASLRQIVKMAGVTTGALYGYFSSKEALFASLVEPLAAAVMGRFMQAQTDFAELPGAEQPEHMGVESADCLSWMLDTMYEHYDEAKLLICCSDGTPYASFIHNMVEVEMEYTYQYMDVLRGLGREVPHIDREFAHMIASGMFNGIFEVFRHDMPKERAVRFVRQLREFYTAGWQKVMGQ